MRDEKGRYIKGQKPESGMFKKGYVPWNAGKHIWSKEERKKRSRMMKGKNHPLYGTHPTEETLKKLSQSHIGVQSREKHPNWKGGISKTSQGYIEQIINNPKGKTKYKLQHRLVVESLIGRKLLKEESVHHRNAIKIDNHPKNLIAFINEPTHKRFERGEKVDSKDIIFDGRKIKVHLKFPRIV
jgi:hypothetical protein